MASIRDTGIGSFILEQSSVIWYFIPVRDSHTVISKGGLFDTPGAYTPGSIDTMAIKAPTFSIIAAIVAIYASPQLLKSKRRGGVRLKNYTCAGDIQVIAVL